MKRKLTLLPVLLTLSLIFSGCQKSPETTLTTQIDNSFSPSVTITKTDQSLNTGNLVENNTLTPIESQQTETIQITTEALDFIFSEQGPYQVGVKNEISYQDPSRNNRKISITIWYPAVLDTESPDNKPVHDAQADLSGAPYPLILSSTKVGFRFRKILPSYGFVYIGIDDIDTYEHFDHNIIDQPLDILFVLEQVSSTPIEGLEGMIDANNSGVMGYSFDGLNALILSGAKINPDFYL